MHAHTNHRNNRIIPLHHKTPNILVLIITIFSLCIPSLSNGKQETAGKIQLFSSLFQHREYQGRL